MSTTQEQPPRPTGEPTGRPGKYQRTVGGLVAALVTTAVVIGAVIWLMGLFRDDVEIGPDKINLAATVAEVQDAGLKPVYPTSLPDGWTATAAEVPQDQDGFEIRMLTDDGKFVGIRLARDSSAVELLHTYVDADPAEEAAYTAEDSVARDWRGYGDAGGDSAYAADLPHHQVVLVYGSAPAADLQDVIGRLTTAPVR